MIFYYELFNERDYPTLDYCDSLKNPVDNIELLGLFYVVRKGDYQDSLKERTRQSHTT